MWNLSYMTPCEVQGTIRVTKPIRQLGPLTDADGNKWDVRGMEGTQDAIN